MNVGLPSRASRVLIFALLSAFTACDGGPSGPGTMTATVAGPTTLGAVVVEVTGVGIDGFVGQAGTRVFGAEVSAAEGRHRVVVVSPSGGTFRFGIEVLDLSEDEPLVTVLQAAGTDNAVLAGTGIEVRVDKQ